MVARLLADSHPDFAYHEYPGGGHWFGNISADWPPLFDFLKNHERPKAAEVVEKEYEAVAGAGFFGNDWSMELGEFVWD
ncbi:hypothetical protein [Cyclobacterium plantarum]|uniref:Uncharacterized protein n=1 Tax=Cyclobacterium plantarum TaxID=2716263 RepID=A0ABX0H5T2_9BACT|nr:hypothetical protein [Cyclobacterium plantarum]NHE55325.1 hypothetical protein [Cyclobacterium plantarum]